MLLSLGLLVSSPGLSLAGACPSMPDDAAAGWNGAMPGDAPTVQPAADGTEPAHDAAIACCVLRCPVGSFVAVRPADGALAFDSALKIEAAAFDSPASISPAILLPPPRLRI